MRFWVYLSLLFCLAGSARAESFCEDENLVLDLQEVWDFHANSLHDFPLPTHRMGQLYPTKSLLHLEAGAAQALAGGFSFPRRPNEVGLPYNLYRLQIQVGADDEPDRQIIDQDYTAGCTGPGASLWPGDHIELQAIPLAPHADGSPRGRETVHLRFWGK